MIIRLKRQIKHYFYLFLFENTFFSPKSLAVSEKRFTFATHLKDNATLLQ